jgi:hypothetical protein
MNYEKMKDKVYQTGNMKFKVVGYETITEHSATLYVKILDAGFFSSVTIEFGSDEIKDGILSGEIWESK